MRGVSGGNHDVAYAVAAEVGGRLGTAIETAGVYAAMVLYIWWGAEHARVLIAVPIVSIVTSESIRGETPRALGIRLTNLWRCTRAFGPGLLVLSVVALALGWALGTIHTTRPADALRYVLWGLGQQYALNGYFVNRLLTCTRHPRIAAALAAACFALVHAPNAFLMGTTLVGGYVAARVYLTYRNVFFLGAAHGLVGTLIAVVVPASVSNRMVVGPP